jgi:hypothetical protein
MKDTWTIKTAHKGVALGAGVYSPQDERYGAERLMVQTHTQNVWYTLDGSTPSATNGFVLLATQSPIIIVVGKGVVPNFLRAASGAVLQYQWIE